MALQQPYLFATRGECADAIKDKQERKTMNEKITKVVGSLTTEKLTKELGEKLLAGCINERKLKTRHVEFIKRSLVYSGWNNSSTISVSESGELLDGQHRLHALKSLGWPRINIQVCTYNKKDITPELRSSFNKAVKQSIADTMKMCYGWDNVSRRCSICASLYKAFISSNGMTKCDDVVTLCVDKAFGDEISEFVTDTTGHKIGRARLNSDMVTAFVAMRIYKGTQKAADIKIIRNDVESRLNCDSNNCITARMNDFAFSQKTYGGEKRTAVYRMCMAIDMALNGKRVCKDLSKFKDEDVKAFGDIIRPVIQAKYNDIDF